ncbi:MAG: hypothetical protein Q4B28_01585 [bacterium]|nr:hypothetical protein [bacterium]
MIFYLHPVATLENNPAVNFHSVGSSYPYIWMRDWILPRTANNQRDDHWHYGGHFVDGRWIDHWTFLDLPLEKKAQEDHRQGRYWRYITIEGLFDKNQTTTNNDLRCFS